MQRIRLLAAVVLILGYAALAPGQVDIRVPAQAPEVLQPQVAPQVDLAKQSLAETILRDAERQLGERPLDPIFRASVMKQLLAKPNEELLRIQSNMKDLNPIVASLGSATQDLVFTPLATPCRLFDSRIGSGYQGAGTGPLAPGVPIALRVADYCSIPWPSAKAASLNFVAVSPTGVGNLRAWPWDEILPAAPNASMLNFTLGQNLANGIAAPICNTATATNHNCYQDLYLAPFGHATDVVIDAVGYYAPPVATPLEVVTTTASFDIGPQQFSFVSTPACPAGYTLTGGGMKHTQAPVLANGAVMVISGEFPVGQWSCGGSNLRPLGETHWIGVCTAYCARIPGR